MNYQIVKAEIGIVEILDKRLKPNSPKNLAIKNGDIRFLGKPCSNKHDGWRYTKGGQCIKCVSIDTRKIRGLLCGSCNQGIGLLNHNSELLRKAALYCE